MQDKRPFDIFAFDLDGTLVHPDDAGQRLIPPDLKAVVHLLSQRFCVVLATGRRYRSALLLQNELPEVRYIVCHNGLVVRDQSGELLHQRSFEMRVIQDVLVSMRQTGLVPVVVLDGVFEGVDFVYERGDLDRRPEIQAIALSQANQALVVENLQSFCAQSHIQKHILEVASIDSLPNLYRAREKLFSQLDESLRAIVVSNCGYDPLSVMEVFPKAVSKWTGIDLIRQRENLDRVVSFGDDENDLEMLRFSTHSVVMGHALDHVKEAGKQIAKDYRELTELLKGFL